jgi:hypothetical protein
MSAVLSTNPASLAVDSLIEGRFAVSGNLVQITLALIDSHTGRSLWIGSISGPRDNLLDVVENVSTQTLDALNEKLGVQRAGNASSPRSTNPAAFEEYLKASCRRNMRRRSRISSGRSRSIRNSPPPMPICRSPSPSAVCAA